MGGLAASNAVWNFTSMRLLFQCFCHEGSPHEHGLLADKAARADYNGEGKCRWRSKRSEVGMSVDHTNTRHLAIATASFGTLLRTGKQAMIEGPLPEDQFCRRGLHVVQHRTASHRRSSSGICLRFELVVLNIIRIQVTNTRRTVTASRKNTEGTAGQCL